MQKRFPKELGGKSDEEIYGVGPFKVKPMACPVIEVAGDGQTAKACGSARVPITTWRPAALWPTDLGYFAADFVKEGDGWKIWHLQYLNDVDCICGQSWAGAQVPYPDLPEFAPLAGLPLPRVLVVHAVPPPVQRRTGPPPLPGLPKPYGHLR